MIETILFSWLFAGVLGAPLWLAMKPPRPSEEQIRRAAYLLWEQTGKPEGMADHFWFEAKRRLQ